MRAIGAANGRRSRGATPDRRHRYERESTPDAGPAFASRPSVDTPGDRRYRKSLDSPQAFTR